MLVGTRIMRWILLALCAVFVVSCGEPVSNVDTLTVSVTLTEGSAFWLQSGHQESVILAGSVEAGLNDQIWTSPDQSATLQLTDGSLIRMKPDSRISLWRPSVLGEQPIPRLLSGQIDVMAQSSRYIFDLYRELPQALRIVQIHITLEPRGTPAEFVLWFDQDAGEVLVNTGVVDVTTTNVQGTLLAEWRAELVPEQPLRIIPPTTPTPTPSRTPTASPTSTLTDTPTATATATRTFIPTRATATTIVVPTNTPGGDGEPKPKPTQTPVPPPTNTPVPPPTDTPKPPDTATPKPTPGLMTP